MAKSDAPILAALSVAAFAAAPLHAAAAAGQPATAEVMLDKAKERFSLVTRRCGSGVEEEIVVCGRRRDAYRVPPDERPADLRTEDRAALLDRRRFECPPIAASCPSPGLTIMTVGSDGRSTFGETRSRTR